MGNHNHLHTLVAGIAARYRLPASLVRAIISVESGWDTTACRFEPHYRYLWDVRRGAPFRRLTAIESASEQAPDDFSAPRGVGRHTEWQHQQTSWGLMQIMGAVAREHGCGVPFLTALCEPSTGLEYGCRHLAHYAFTCRFLERFGWPGVCRAFNGGPYAAVHNTNPEYPQKVAAALGGAWPKEEHPWF